MKCACISLLVFLFIVFGAGTPFIVYRNTGASENVPDTNGTLPETNSTAPAGNVTTTTTNGTATNGTTTTNNSTSASTRRVLAACPPADSDALLTTEDGDGTFVCTYASGPCTYHSETGVLLDDQTGGRCPGEANFEARARKSRRGMRYEAISKRVLAKDRLS